MTKKVAAGLKEALAHARQNSNGGGGWALPTAEEIKALRESLKLTQVEFANCFGFDLTSVRNWEQIRTAPERVKALYLRMIETDATAVMKFLTKVESRVTKKGTRARELA